MIFSIFSLMRSLLFLLSLLFVLVAEAPAQAKKKAVAPAKKAASAKTVTKNMTVAPKLTDKEPLFAGFTGSFMKFGKVSGTSRPFTATVEYSPWFFTLKGNASAGHNTADLDILLEDLIGVLAYYNAEGKVADGTSYQAAPFDFMIYLDDEPIIVTDVKIALIGTAAAGSKVATQASTWNFKSGEVFKSNGYYDAVFDAMANPLDKSNIEREIAAEKKRVLDSIANEKQRVQDSLARIERRKRDSIANEKRRRLDSIAEIEALKEQARRKAAAAAARKKREQMEEEYYDDEEYYEEDEYYEEEEYVPVKKKRKTVAPKKRAPAKKKAPAKRKRN